MILSRFFHTTSIFSIYHPDISFPFGLAEAKAPSTHSKISGSTYAYTMRPADYTLSFLDHIGLFPSDQMVEEAWQDRVFPLAALDDYKENWQRVFDPCGLFVHSSGLRCRVEPKPHHLNNCKVNIRAHDGTSRPATIPYEAIVFAKVMHARHRPAIASMPPGYSFPIVEHRLFVDVLVGRLPVRWREVIVHCSLHLYNDKSGPSTPLSVDIGTHQPLSQPSNIRLLKLLPAENHASMLQCTLAESVCSPDAQYEALSYVWGKQSPDTMQAIQLNGLPFNVGKNLEEALRQLRPRVGLPRILWIDAVCIDQTNTQERNQQVAQMDNVYRNAARVTVWLGPETDMSSGFFQMSPETSDDQLFGNSPVKRKEQPSEKPRLKHKEQSFREYFLEHKDRPLEEFILEHYDMFLEFPFVHSRPGVPERIDDQLLKEMPHPIPPACTSTVKCCLEVLTRPWWKRVWVLQELVLASNVTIRCGSGSMGWTFLQAMLFLFTRRRSNDPNFFIASNDLSLRPAEWELQSKLSMEIQKVFPFFFLQKNSVLASRIRPVSMATLVTLTNDFEATDPRDKVFALVGLLPTDSQERAIFTPDYTTNVRRLCIRAARHWLESTRTLQAISSWETAPKDSEVHDAQRPTFPSWVPDLIRPQIWNFSSILISDFLPYKLVYEYLVEKKAREQPQPPDSGAEKQGAAATDAEFSRLQLYNASLHRQSPYPLEFTAYDEVFLPRGVTVDSIVEIGPMLDTPQARNGRSLFHGGDFEADRATFIVSELKKIIQRWKSVACLSRQGSYPFAGQSRHEAFWRTIFLDRYRSGGGMGEPLNLTRIEKSKNGNASDHQPGGPQFRGMFPPANPKEEEVMLRILVFDTMELGEPVKVNLFSLFMRMFRTSKGYIGIGHPCAMVGDEVVVLLGSPVPLILREQFPLGHAVVGQRHACAVSNAMCTASWMVK
ncbi:hypothetical protein MAPG_08533 [Magnaporthiopsis poae ATCC 64411]|uniref:Heterokaryon incompatibility domain-containing protein n=1 Tax=Magnaporthiopsis poae (strain ATCC 64411 / 73-15) TaxID=644358 RepID=A0A0C4E7L8_MAGP6|nr:hypothetical protein MAPG_08533 [Magnaporthiopsis poae ATCC 64411]